jgi:hypothetical protein
MVELPKFTIVMQCHDNKKRFWWLYFGCFIKNRLRSYSTFFARFARFARTLPGSLSPPLPTNYSDALIHNYTRANSHRITHSTRANVGITPTREPVRIATRQ